MISSEVTNTKLTLKYQDDGGSSTFSNILSTASNAGIMMAAEAINSLQEKTAERVFKVVETQITYTND